MIKPGKSTIWFSSALAVMRVNLRSIFSLIIIVICMTTVSFWYRCGNEISNHSDDSKKDNNFYREKDVGGEPYSVDEETPPGSLGTSLHRAGLIQDAGQRQGVTSTQYEEVECLINDESTIIGRREGNEVFLPFSFIAKYFEVYGKITEHEGYERFEWKHSYSKIYRPHGKYSTDGIFMSFEFYNVEVRDRVKSISGTEGVPISNQWGAQGYFYPIQIAQYGLSHYSKQLIEHGEARTTIIEDAEEEGVKKWLTDGGDTKVDNVMNHELGSRVIQFSTSESLKHHGIKRKMPTDGVVGFILDLQVRFKTNGTITLNLESKNGDRYRIHYVQSDLVIRISGSDIFYGIGVRTNGWSRLTRDLAIDLQKGVNQRHRSKKKKFKVILHHIVSLTLHGKGEIDNIVLTNAAHMQFFHYAAQWLLKHQDRKGGWPIMVTRRLAGGLLELAPGWYSAMAQGQAMSLLARAYIKTKNREYLNSALNAMKLFDVPSKEGGVRAVFMDKRPWYEEYPTTPSSFVLNGFIYSLIGLYDLKSIVPEKYSSEVERLFNTGMDSLKSMLPLFDTGTGSVYDLRHYTLGVAPNRARWDYHATHINQLLLLSTIDSDPILLNTAKRWISYMSGKRAPHN